MSISVFEAAGSPLCVAAGDGEKVYRRLTRALDRDVPATLSFRNVNTLTYAFLNAAIGQLYGRFSETRIGELLRIEEMEPDDLAMLERVVDTAKLYFKDKPAFEAAVRAAEDL